jgi:hypothetical protein
MSAGIKRWRLCKEGFDTGCSTLLTNGYVEYTNYPTIDTEEQPGDERDATLATVADLIEEYDLTVGDTVHIERYRREIVMRMTDLLDDLPSQASPKVIGKGGNPMDDHEYEFRQVTSDLDALFD